MKYVLGVDGGGTKTYASIVSVCGRLISSGSAGPSNYHDSGIEATKHSLACAIDIAIKQSELEEVKFEAAFLGMAGVVSQADRSVIQRIAKDLELPLNERLGIDHDCRIALAGGLCGRPGIVQIAGTGASTYGRNSAAEEWRSGGWAHLLADEGGGYWFGLSAMKAAVRAEDGRSKETVLRQLVKEQLGLVSMNEIMHRLYVVGMSRAQIAALCPLLIDAARQGDEIALKIVEDGMEHLSECVEAVAAKLGFAQSRSCELAIVGGLFNAGDFVIQVLKESVYRRLPGCRITLAELQPVLGACLLALELINIRADRKITGELINGSQSKLREVQSV